MSRWACPKCNREFGRAGQSHVCFPGNRIDDTFAGRPEQRAIYAAVAEHLRQLGTFHEDAVGVGVFLKRQRKFAELRPKSKWLSLDLILPRRVDGARISRRIDLAAGRVVHIIRLHRVEDVDEQVRSWLTEAFVAAE